MPPRYLLSLSEAAARWSVSSFDVVTWALEELLALSIAPPPVRIGPTEFLSGLVDVEPTHVLPLFRREAPTQTVPIRCVKDRDGELRWIVDPAEGIIITAGDVFIRRAEVERFEQEHRIIEGDQSPWAATPRSAGGRRPGPGIPPRHDWDSFYAVLVRRIHEHGMPPTQAELVREMRDWFERRDDKQAPDQGTIARKIRIVWQELHRP
jgi:hypothetical protein